MRNDFFGGEGTGRPIRLCDSNSIRLWVYYTPISVFYTEVLPILTLESHAYTLAATPILVKTQPLIGCIVQMHPALMLEFTRRRCLIVLISQVLDFRFQDRDSLRIRCPARPLDQTSANRIDCQFDGG